MFNMNLPMVSNFFGCFDLRTGGLIIGWLGVVTSCISIFQSLIFLFLYRIEYVFVYGILNVFGLIISACWLYGIYQNRPSYMLLNVITSAIGSIILYIVLVISMGFYSILALHGQMLLGIGLFVFCIITVGSAYLFIVKYSIYKNIKEANSASTGYEFTSPDV
ncbi:uncharacterized protein LOC116338304 [Contarinia nasturtii]|uniref:uncharacterized protein LOC116338304 n=1 Tax=Contarinia nasturtii TaxID=265458 RepID=UPI0012D3D1C6|nr:uncharacterized protein LOC116338304 [Contarinia nasturtii]